MAHWATESKKLIAALKAENAGLRGKLASTHSGQDKVGQLEKELEYAKLCIRSIENDRDQWMERFHQLLLGKE
jgi:hypothetical protein